MFADYLPLIWDIAAPVAILLFGTFLGVFLNRKFEKRSKLLTYLGHVANHLDKNLKPPLQVYTHEVFIKNSGNKSAENVRVSHPYKLHSFDIYPDIIHEVETLPAGGEDIIIPKFVPNEEVRISYLYFTPYTYDQIRGTVKSDDGFADEIQMTTTQKFSNWFNISFLLFALFGFLFVLYLIYRILFSN